MHCLLFLTESEEDNKNAVCLKFECLYFLLFFYLIIIWAENIFNFEKRVLFGKSWILTWKLNKLFYFLLMHNFNLETAKFFIFPRFVRSSLVPCSLLRRSRPAWSAVPQTVTTSCHWRPGTPTGFEDSCFNCFLIIESGIEPNEGKPIFFSSLISWVLFIFCDFFHNFPLLESVTVPIRVWTKSGISSATLIPRYIFLHY